MVILKLSSYYYPEQISSSHLTADLEEAYSKVGYKTVVYAPTPCRGIDTETRDLYKKITHEERLNGSVFVHRFQMFTEPKNPILRAIRYLLIQVKQYFSALREKDIDVLSCGSTPPTTGVMMSLLKRKLSKRYGRPVRFIYALQDAFPDSLVFTGLTKKGSIIYKIGNKIADYTYRNADIIIAISNDLKKMLLDKGISEGKIKVIRNWIDTEVVRPVSQDTNNLFKECQLVRDVFYVVYAGNLGKAQNIEVIIEAATLLKDIESVGFLIFGNGAEEENIRKKVELSGLANMKIYPLQPIERVSEVYSLGSVSIITCKEGTGLRAFPSKTMSILATGTPVIAAYDVESELSELIKDKKCGIVVAPNDAEALSDAVLKLKSDHSRLSQLSANARATALTEFDMNKCVGEYVECIESICADNK